MSNFENVNNSKIIGIQFSMLSPEEIRKGSVAEITNREMYNNNAPVVNGLFDSRMGVLEKGLICPTDGKDYMDTPGYFGHIELSRPVFFIQYINTIQKILRCVCFKCNRLLISKMKYKHVLKLNSQQRWKFVFNRCKTIKRCGEDSDDGCGWLQPKKYKKEGIASLYASWEDSSSKNDEEPDKNKDKDKDDDENSIPLYPELVLKIFKRIPDEDVYFMGFSPIWSRPDWMICQVLPVPPPAVRPSVKHDAQQRSEDDLTHILMNIIKHNQILSEKIKLNAKEDAINDVTMVLQYYVASLVNNKLPGAGPVAQRSGRPLKAITDRLNGKSGRMRSNLMAKRVDFSARSVIGAEPNISIREIGVPKKIAMNITKPVVVNNLNKDFLMKLIQNGPDVWPGAKILERQNGENVTLRYLDRKTIILQNGDIVHRHMMNGDVVLFNRQPSLHRMSMMGHLARIMIQGDTFRMNVADTKPYNADFDGDEMNLHMPQDPEAESELRNLAAIPYQIISPANNAPIIGIFQDSMLGSYQFTRKDVSFTPKDAMKLLMQYKKTDASIFRKRKDERISNFEILSQILAPLSLKVNNGQYEKEKGDDKEKYATSNNVVEIINGKYLRGQLDKGILGSGTKGIIHRVCNDFGNMASAEFIDDLQNIITEYMKHSSFSVGISDLITDKATNDKIVSLVTNKKTEVKNLIHQVQLGIFENTSGKTNEEEFETRVNNILGSIQKDAGRAAIDNLSKTNRFLTMFNAGSKGSEINIQQMTACLGQQNVDGKRIPYGFEHRTLPHYTKFDDGPASRGFVENSYIGGMSPQEVYFHAMGGRIGLIDTAVKTSTTGYIQRRLIKSLEDAMVNYDMTVRNSKNKIIQFSFGEDSIDTVKVENQIFPIVEMTVQEIYGHFMLMDSENKTKNLSNIFISNAYKLHKSQNEQLMVKSLHYANEMVDGRKLLISNVFNNKSDKLVRAPVAFAYIIKNIMGQQYINSNSLVDLTMLDAYEMIENAFSKLEKIHFAKPTPLFKMLYFYYLSPKDLLINKRFNRKSLEILIETVILTYKRSIVNPGEMVGIVAAQSIGEPTTQMSLVYDENIWCQKINKISGKKYSIVIKIGELCDKIIEENPGMTFNTGHEDSVETLLDNLEDEYYIIGVDSQEKTHWNKISHVSRHPVNGGLVKVKTRSGREVTTTLSHSHLIRNNNVVEPIRGDELCVGMRIPVAKNVDNNFIETRVKIGDKLIELNNLFGWFIGAYLAEGNVTEYGIAITNVAQNYIDNTTMIANMFDKNANVNTRQCEYGPSTVTSFSCKELANFLFETCGTGSFVKRVPDFAFTSSLEFKAGLIRGYMDGDGNFQCDEKHHQIRVCSRSERLIKDMALMLNYFGIFSSIKIQRHKNMPLYHLYISPKYAKIYKENIGSVLHESKLDNIIEYVERNDAHNLSDEIDKINGLGEIISTCGKALKLPGQSRTYRRWKNKSSIGRRTLKKYIDIFESHQNKNLIENELKLLNQAEKSDVIWDEIISLEIVEMCEKYVYDFTVPKNQTFMTHSGVLVHNTLNTFHFAGVASKSNVTRGVPRIEELLSLHHPIKNPSLTIFLKQEDENDKQRASTIQYMIEYTKLSEIVKSIGICFDPDDMNTLIEEDREMMSQFNEFEKMVDECSQQTPEATIGSNKPNDDKMSPKKSKWIIRMEMDPEVMLEKNITMDDVNFALVNSYGTEIDCVYSDYNSEKLVFRIRMDKIVLENKKPKINPLDQSDQIYILKNFQDQMLSSVVLRGIKNIKKVILRKVKDNLTEKAGGFVKNDIWILDTIGTNLLDVLALDYINVNKTISNDVLEILDVLGIEAARQSLYNEMSEVLESDASYVNAHHMSLLCDRMTHNHRMISVFRHGINSDDIGPIAKASFEETPEMFLKAARHAELDSVRGISANIMCGQEGTYGTSSFQLVLDLNEMSKLEEQYKYEYVDTNKMIDRELMKNIDDITECSIQNLTINTNISNLKEVEMNHDDEYNPFE